MAANEISNLVAAMIVFQPAATQGAVQVFNCVGVDQLVPTANKGVTRVGVGRYTVSLVDKISPGPNFGAIALGTGAAAYIVTCSIDINGDLVVNIDTNAGAPSDVSPAYAIVFRFPSID